jgi:hypothetical protein
MALHVELAAALGQVGWNVPDAFGQAFNDAGAAQGFKPAHVGLDLLGCF